MVSRAFERQQAEIDNLKEMFDGVSAKFTAKLVEDDEKFAETSRRFEATLGEETRKRCEATHVLDVRMSDVTQQMLALDGRIEKGQQSFEEGHAQLQRLEERFETLRAKLNRNHGEYTDRVANDEAWMEKVENWIRKKVQEERTSRTGEE